MSSKKAKTKKEPSEPLKVVVIGEPGVGKTCMIHTFLHGEFPTAYIATVMEPTKSTVKCGETEHAIEIIDTPGQVEFTQNRVALYTGASLFLVCCSVVDPLQFENLDRWVSEIASHTPDAKFVLVGLKTDLRTEESVLNGLRQQGLAPFPEFNGSTKASTIGALTYLECSALLNAGVRDVFSESCNLLFTQDSTRGGCCNVM